jgi:hypothetical protein
MPRGTYYGYRLGEEGASSAGCCWTLTQPKDCGKLLAE